MLLLESAKECSFPQLTFTIKYLHNGGKITGLLYTLFLLGNPNSPSLLLPQPYTDPSSVQAKEWNEEVLISITFKF